MSDLNVMVLEEKDAHDRAIRNALRAAREAQGLTQQQVADRVTALLELERPLTGAAVSEWERFGRHPAINVMRGWARVLGRRVLVQLDESAGERIAVLVRPEAADLARSIDLLSDEDRGIVASMVSRMNRRRL